MQVSWSGGRTPNALVNEEEPPEQVVASDSTEKANSTDRSHHYFTLQAVAPTRCQNLWLEAPLSLELLRRQLLFRRKEERLAQ